MKIDALVGSQATCCYEVMRFLLPTMLVLVLYGCAGGNQREAGAGAGPTMIYSPPTRLGGRGSLILIPPSSPSGTAVQQAALETRDRVPIRATGKWLLGTWLFDAKPADVSRLACNSGTTVTYNPDGTTSFFGGRGRWQLADSVLTETLLEAFDSQSPEVKASVGKSQRVILQRVGPNEASMRYGNEWISLLRC